MDEGYDAVNVARARDLVAGRPLADAATRGDDRARQPEPDRPVAGPGGVTDGRAATGR